MRLTDIGEFGLIGRISKILSQNRPDVVVGIGDDVAVLNFSGSEYLLATCDAQVENTHFRMDWITPHQLGRKVAAVNLSDIASMGGVPTWGLVSLVLPSETEVSFVDELYAGMNEEMTSAGAAIVGGNLSRTRSEVVIDLCLLGKVAAEEIVLRRGAIEGDLVLVTGWPGESRAGLELILNRNLAVAEATGARVLKRHFTPSPRLREGRLLGRSGKAHAMADVSDGIIADLRHICEASGVGAEIRMDDIPVSSACREVAAAVGTQPENWVLTGGEDYELIFTASAGDAVTLKKALEDEAGTACHIIGEIKPRGFGIKIVFPDGELLDSPAGSKGWDHFTS